MSAIADPPPTPIIQILDVNRLADDALLDARQLAAVLCCSVGHVRRLALDELRPVRLGSAVPWLAGPARDYIRHLERKAER